ncbi:hypothetical protein [Psychrobacillus soli]|nr:hypothetical protein [Psychrobacillus soli]
MGIVYRKNRLDFRKHRYIVVLDNIHDVAVKSNIIEFLVDMDG